MFKKILIANRGEIAVRIMRACQEMGIPSVAIYSEVDRASLHVRKADEAYAIGAAAATESYLSSPKILEVARKCGAEAIHPGYGFLSETPEFAAACARAGVKFIGPTAAAMAGMGSKTRARQAMQQAGVAVVPGSDRGLELRAAEKLAGEIGYPVMIRAAAGGGGKGMRLVRTAREMRGSFEAARSEAERSFGDGEVYLEKLLERPRHIEMQVLADEHGNAVYLGERECSIQRRHQKVLEESPSPAVDEAMRGRMGEVAVRAARAAGYTNAGTVEFLIDEEHNFYFLEMNTRLQVEHPVTEMITGLDLVQLQIRIAAGGKLPLAQEQVQLRGHAVECRIYAEDPENKFFPSPGKITRLLTAAGPGIREDSGIYEGWTVPVEYDPLLSKLIAYASTRAEAIARMQRALGEYFAGGIKTNVALFRRILGERDFQAGKFDTEFLDRMLLRDSRILPDREDDFRIAAIAAAVFTMTNQAAVVNAEGGAVSDWKRTALQEGLREK